LLVLAAVAAFVAIVVAAGRNERESTAQRTTAAPAPRFAGAVRPPGLPAARFELRDQDGRAVSSASLRGRPAVIAFLDTRCGAPCLVMTQQVKGALDDLGRPVPSLAVSLDPRTDTAARARRFLGAVGMTGRMRFLLGSREELAPVWRQFGVGARRDPLLVLVDRAGRQRVGFPASQATPERLVHDLNALGAG
jgi:protein SCO1/2